MAIGVGAEGVAGCATLVRHGPGGRAAGSLFLIDPAVWRRVSSCDGRMVRCALLLPVAPDPGGEAYDRMGEAYAAYADGSPFNALYDRPAIVALAGDVHGLRVLDVGCAAGALSAALAARGARVLGVDASQTMIRLAERRLDGQASFRVADISRPLDFVPSGSIDLVVASLVLHYVEDWVPPLREFMRVLAPGGRIVFSTHHPGEDWHWFKRPNYFVTEQVIDNWEAGGTTVDVRFYRRPLSAIFAAIRDAGLSVDELVEPMPLPECQERYPDSYLTLTTAPRFLYFRLIPRRA